MDGIYHGMALQGGKKCLDQTQLDHKTKRGSRYGYNDVLRSSGSTRYSVAHVNENIITSLQIFPASFSSFTDWPCADCLIPLQSQPLPPYLQIYLLERAVTPGNSLPSNNSKLAPPPVETWLNLSSTPYLAATVAVSPPPIMTIFPS
jgi:hypothetical protein